MPFPLSFRTAFAISLTVCLCAAVLEGLFAGRNVKATFASLRFPRYSPPLWAWILVGVVYYVLFFVIVFRILRTDQHELLAALCLVTATKMMFINAFWNLLFFRLRSVSLGLILGVPYAVMAIVLFVCLLQLDRVAAWTLSPYLVYLCYANYWGYGLWKLNRDDDRGIACLIAAWRGSR
ncbi:MAG: tryptophan-rich sensory protein [Anaerolineae bacterium]|nr:tryptophan-rich sensory protein [Phycisphaerae bacterium]